MRPSGQYRPSIAPPLGDGYHVPRVDSTLGGLVPLLFSYGTLQRDEIQRTLFGRSLSGASDQLIGFRISGIDLDDPDLLHSTGTARHSIVLFTGDGADRVNGTVFEITDSDLARADQYEPAPYTRVAATLASGKVAWVYADSRATP